MQRSAVLAEYTPPMLAVEAVVMLVLCATGAPIGVVTGRFSEKGYRVNFAL